MTSTPSSDRQKIGAEHRLDLGQLEAVAPEALSRVLGQVIAGVIDAVLEEGADLDTLNVVVTPEATLPPVVVPDSFGVEAEQTPDVLHVRAWAELDRPSA